MSARAVDKALEGLRRMRADVGPEPRRGSEQARDEADLDRAIAYLEGLPSPSEIWTNLVEVGFLAPWSGERLEIQREENRDAFLVCLAGGDLTPYRSGKREP